MKSCFIFILIVFSQITLLYSGDKVPFSPESVAWADSVFQTLTLEEKVAQLFIVKVNNEDIAEQLIKNSAQPSFVTGERSLFEKHLKRNRNFPYLTYVPDISGGFDSGVPEFYFPNDKTILSLNKEQQIMLFPQLFEWMSMNDYSMLLAASDYPFDIKYDVEKKYTVKQTIWSPTGYLKDGYLETLPLNIVDIPNKFLGALPTYSALILQNLNSNSNIQSSVDMSVEQLLYEGNIFITDDFFTDLQRFISAFNSEILSITYLESICKYVLAFRYETQNINAIPTFNIPPEQKELNIRQAYDNSISIFQRNHEAPFPLTSLDFDIGYFSENDEYSRMFKSMADNYAEINNIDFIPRDYKLIFWLPGTHPLTDAQISDILRKIKEQYPQVFVVMMAMEIFPFETMPAQLDALVYSPADTPYSWMAMAEAVFNGIAVNRKPFAQYIPPKLKAMEAEFPKTRLKFGIPEEAGMYRDTLALIDKIMLDGIKKEATPGARIMAIKNGIIVFDKCYGWHTYDKKQPVEKGDIYDLASVTKIMVTTSVLMQQYDLGRWRLVDTIANFIPEIKETNKKDITMRQLLLHESGLPAFISFYTEAIDKNKLKGTLFSSRKSSTHPIMMDRRLFMNKTAVYRDDVFSNKSDSGFSVPVAANYYMNHQHLDTMFYKILDSRLRPGQNYLYSDLNFILLQRIIENLYSKPLDVIADEIFYKPLGASSLGFNPWKTIPQERIAPTENDISFRKQLLRGYVHDQAAAMMGGVSGHAGLFGNANDIAKMLQMLLNKGVYGGHRYLTSETVDFFTSGQSNKTKRGLGFDKHDPDKNTYSPLSSPSAYGHTGFTGILVWIDPEYELIYIFLSNRIHPHQYNGKLMDLRIRSRVQDIIYRSIGL